MATATETFLQGAQQTKQQIAAMGTAVGETWSPTKIDQIYSQILSGQRTLSSVQQDVIRRTGGVGVSQETVDTISGMRDRNTAGAEIPAHLGVTRGGSKPEEFDRGTAATISNLLRQYGLEELIPLVDQWVRGGMSWPEVEAQLRDPSTSAGQVFDRHFPEVRQRREANLAPMSVAQIQSYRTTLNQLVSARGLSEAFPDIKETARQWIVGDKGLDEMAERLDMLEGNVARQIAGDPNVQAELEAWERYYGVRPTLGNLVAMAINPAEATPALARRFASVRFDQEAGRAGFGDLDRGEAERLTDLGVDASRSGEQFGALVRSRELFGALDRGEDNIDRATQLDAAFSNSEAAKRRIEDRARRRVAQSQAGGSLATSRRGFGGLATSSDT
jgi:hypothetical protein